LPPNVESQREKLTVKVEAALAVDKTKSKTFPAAKLTLEIVFATIDVAVFDSI
jgi:hypothetical protein